MGDDADRHYTILFSQKSGLHAGAHSYVGVCVGNSCEHSSIPPWRVKRDAET